MPARVLPKLREEWGGPVDDSRAWTCLALNLVVLPGLGSLLGRRLVAGVGQIVLSSTGVVLSLFWVLNVLAFWLRSGELAAPGPDLLYALGGLGLFGLGWLSSLVTSLVLLREARRADRD